MGTRFCNLRRFMVRHAIGACLKLHQFASSSKSAREHFLFGIFYAISSQREAIWIFFRCAFDQAH